MPLPPIAIELSPTDAASAEAAVLIDACSRSLPDRGCRLGREGGERTESSGVAIVRRRGELRYVIELGLRQRGEPRWVMRELSFKPDDPPAERWRTVGLVIGTLVGEADAAKPAEARKPPGTPPAAPAKPAASLHPAPSHDATLPEPRVWLGLDALGGPALDDGTWRFGGDVRAEYRPASSGLMASASGRYELRPRSESGVGVDWLSGSLGAGVAAELGGRVSAEATLAVVIERIHADVDEPGSGETDEGSRWVLGGRLEVGAMVSPWPRFGLWAAGSVGVPASPTRIVLRDRELAVAPSPTVGLALGVRIGLF
jgi:hypothetical protein